MNVLGQSTTDTLNADENEVEHEAQARCVITKDADRRLNNQDGQDHGLDNGRQGKKPAWDGGDAKRDRRARKEYSCLVYQLRVACVKSVDEDMGGRKRTCQRG